MQAFGTWVWSNGFNIIGTLLLLCILAVLSDIHDLLQKIALNTAREFVTKVYPVED